ncbi:metallophosphoesterase [Robertmurraya sp.]|uniref:metallophosphoesterase n=1 Tax=Robertmurraya sp. TaxID=2837525 RepID=UPI00370478A2
MNTKMSRRRFLKRGIGTILTGIVAVGGGGFYAREIEPKLLTIKKHTITHPMIPNGFNGFKILQFSDTHVGFQYDLTQLKELVNKINSLEPDMILFTGDLMDTPNQYAEINSIAPILKNLHAPFGSFAIYGNHDHGGYGSDLYRNVMKEAGFTLLLNEAHQVSLLTNESLYIAGIDDAMLGRPDIQATLESIPNEAYTILLSHAPDLADQAANIGNVQLQLSGHSHGGQIQIPFLGAIIKPPFAKKYYEGFYQIGQTSNPLTLYVNRGLGTTRLPFRFLSPPEITLFTLQTLQN